MVLETLQDIPIKTEMGELTVPSSSGALIKCGKELILYKRDNKPNIPHPGMLGIIGGVVESSLGETAGEALRREIKEELNIDIDPSQIKYLGTLEAGDDQTHIKHISLVEITPEQKRVMRKGEEGKELKFFSPDKLPDEENLVPDLKTFFVDHRESVISWLNGQRVKASDLGLIS